jgi:hypothetical protein
VEFSWLQRLVICKMVKFVGTLLENKFSKNTYLLCLLSAWIVMFYLHWHNVIQFLSHSTYGWIELGLTPLRPLWTSWIGIGYLAMWLSTYLRLQILMELHCAKLVKPLLVEFQLINKLLACVKDEYNNFATLNYAMSTVVSCDVLQLEKPFSSTCFGHVMLKVY